MIINIKNVKLGTGSGLEYKKQYENSAKSNENELINTMKDLLIKTDTKSSILPYGKGFGDYKSRKPKTFCLK